MSVVTNEVVEKVFSCLHLAVNHQIKYQRPSEDDILEKKMARYKHIEISPLASRCEPATATFSGHP